MTRKLLQDRSVSALPKRLAREARDRWRAEPYSHMDVLLAAAIPTALEEAAKVAREAGCDYSHEHRRGPHDHGPNCGETIAAAIEALKKG